MHTIPQTVSFLFLSCIDSSKLFIPANRGEAVRINCLAKVPDARGDMSHSLDYFIEKWSTKQTAFGEPRIRRTVPLLQLLRRTASRKLTFHTFGRILNNTRVLDPCFRNLPESLFPNQTVP